MQVIPIPSGFLPEYRNALSLKLLVGGIESRFFKAFPLRFGFSEWFDAIFFINLRQSVAYSEKWF